MSGGGAGVRVAVCPCGCLSIWLSSVHVRLARVLTCTCVVPFSLRRCPLSHTSGLWFNHVDAQAIATFQQRTLFIVNYQTGYANKIPPLPNPVVSNLPLGEVELPENPAERIVLLYGLRKLALRRACRCQDRLGARSPSNARCARIALRTPRASRRAPAFAALPVAGNCRPLPQQATPH